MPRAFTSSYFSTNRNLMYVSSDRHTTFMEIYPPDKAKFDTKSHAKQIRAAAAAGLPAVVELDVVETAPVMRTATKNASSKPAKLSNGVTVQVPDFVNEGDRVRVDPRSGVYLERAK